MVNLFEVGAVAGVVVKRVKGVKKLVAQPMRQAQGRGSRQPKAKILAGHKELPPTVFPALADLVVSQTNVERRQRSSDNDSKVV